MDQPDARTLQWVIEEVIPSIADMGGDNTRRKWWNEAANILGGLADGTGDRDAWGCLSFGEWLALDD